MTHFLARPHGATYSATVQDQALQLNQPILHIALIVPLPSLILRSRPTSTTTIVHLFILQH
jgi:hypothetical protein